METAKDQTFYCIDYVATINNKKLNIKSIRVPEIWMKVPAEWQTEQILIKLFLKKSTVPAQTCPFWIE